MKVWYSGRGWQDRPGRLGLRTKLGVDRATLSAVDVAMIAGAILEVGTEVSGGLWDGKYSTSGGHSSYNSRISQPCQRHPTARTALKLDPTAVHRLRGTRLDHLPLLRRLRRPRTHSLKHYIGRQRHPSQHLRRPAPAPRHPAHGLRAHRQEARSATCAPSAWPSSRTGPMSRRCSATPAPSPSSRAGSARPWPCSRLTRDGGKRSSADDALVLGCLDQGRGRCYVVVGLGSGARRIGGG